MFIPGPVDVAPEVLAAQARPMLPRDSREFEEIYQRVNDNTRPLFLTRGRVFWGAFSGSGAQEMAIRSLVEKSVLCCANGAYGERWRDIALSNNKNVDVLEAEWGQPIRPEALLSALREKHYEAVSVIHNETSTGVENPLPELAAVIQETSPETLILVDAVTSMGGVKIEMDAWGLDFVFSSSQHCLALPPGLSLFAASERAFQKAETVTNRGWYFDLLRNGNSKEPFATTLPISLIYALDVQLNRIQMEGLENRYARHAALARSFETWASEYGMALFAPEPYRSKTVVTVKNSLAWNITDLNKFLQLRGMRIANGCAKLKDATYRVAVMGEIQMSDLENLERAMEAFISK